MRKLKIAMLAMLCAITAGLCGVLAYGMTGHNIYSSINYYERDCHLVLEKEVPLDGIDSISISYHMNNNDIYLYEGEGNTLTIKEYNEADLNENELSTVTVSGSRIEVKGKKRTNRRYPIGLGYADVVGYTEVWLPASYRGELDLAASSGNIVSEMDLTLEKDLQAAATSGDITMPDITAGNVSLECSSGNVRIGNITAGQNGTAGDITIVTTSGDVTVKQLTGDEVSVECSSGQVKAEAVTGTAQISTTSGDIMVQRIDGNATAEASSGYVKIMGGSGSRTISTTSGDITLEGAEDVWQLHASSGEVWVKGQSDNGLVETTSGDINLELEKLTGALEISSSSGYVKIKLPQDSAFDFSADTSSGDINTFFDDDLKFSKRGNNAQGTYGQNTQQNSIRIDTTSGDIMVIK